MQNTPKKILQAITLLCEIYCLAEQTQNTSPKKTNYKNESRINLNSFLWLNFKLNHNKKNKKKPTYTCVYYALYFEYDNVTNTFP